MKEGETSIVRVGIRKDEVVILGRYLFVFRPVIDSILDTIFWGDGYKSLAHIVILSYLTYHHLCGIRFMFLFTVFHFFMKAGKRSECSEEEAVYLFKATVHDLTIVMRRYKPSVRHVSPVLLLAVVLGAATELYLHQSVTELLDASIGPLSVLVILVCYGLVDPRYTRNYTISAGGSHSRTSSQGSQPPLTKLMPHDAAPSTSKSHEVEGGDLTLPESARAVSNALGTKGTAAAPSGQEPSPLLTSPKLAYELVPPLLAESAAVCPYSPASTPTATWDDLLPPCPTIPLFMHKVLMLYTRAPGWVDWKVSSDGTRARNHPISWTVVKAGLNTAMVEGVSFDTAVQFVNDDPDFTKPIERLHVWRFDKLLGEFRRLCRIDAHSRVVHMVYKQLIFGVAPRDATMYMTAKELSPEEIAYYGLCAPHNNNREVTDGVGRVFVSSSAPADGVPPVKGHVRCVVHRQAIIIREIPAKRCIEIMTIVCGEPGGNVPARIVDLSRGAQLAVVLDMKKSMLDWARETKKRV